MRPLWPSAIVVLCGIATGAAAQQSSLLTNEQQVGNSILGTFGQPKFPKWLGDEAEPPWGYRTTKNAGPGDVPLTNTTRYYDWTVTRSQLSPDGVLRDVILVNGQFPGPLLEANWGDWIEVTVHNKITGPEEGTSLHWHGSSQRGTQWADGVPGISQCPIAPGNSYTYRFRADAYGTSWYHAHYSAQYTAGAAGPIQIYGPSQLDYDIDLGPVMLTDWYHIPYFSIVENVLSTDYSEIPPVSDSGLINGRGRFNCSAPSYSNSTEFVGSNLSSNLTFTCDDDAPYSRFRFQSGKTHRLRLINHGADGIQKFAIDGHTMTVIATDYVPTIPYREDIITLGVGQRTDVLVTALGVPQSSCWMRSQLPGGTFCGGNDNTQAIRAAIYYEKADSSLEPSSISSDNDAACVDSPLAITEPEYAIEPSANPFQQDIILGLEVNATGSFIWTMNGETFRANYNDPLLFDVTNKALLDSGVYPGYPEANVYDFGKDASILLNLTNTTPFPHPIHLHGYHFQVLASGPNIATSVYPSTIANPLDPAPATVWDGSTMGHKSNPMRRDVQIIPALGYMALQFEANNPGIWPFHCHTAWHLSGGMSINLVTQPDDIVGLPAGTRASTCAAWNVYTSHDVVDQIDAGS